MDLTWVAMVPICVKSPGVIIKVGGVGVWNVVVDRVQKPCTQWYFSPFLASPCSNGILDGSSLLAGISLVYGLHLVGGSEYMVFDYEKGRIQDIKSRSSCHSANRFRHVLHYVDLDSMYHLSRRIGYILKNGFRTN